MSKRIPVRILAAGAALTVGLSACGPKNGGQTENPPPPEVEPVEEPEPEPIPTANPPPPDPGDLSDNELPTWDAVKSGHPEGATNPPSPFLRVTPEGDCYKFFRGMMMPPRPGEVIGDRVEDCPDECGTQIQCPQPRAQELLDAYNSGEDAPQKTTPTKPTTPTEGL